MFSRTFATNISVLLGRRLFSSRDFIQKTVDPYSNISIASKFNLRVKPYDALECQDSNRLRVSLRPTGGRHVNDLENIVGQFAPKITIKNENVEIVTSPTIAVAAPDYFDGVQCLVEVPVKSNINILGERDVALEDLQGEDISVQSGAGDILTKNLQSLKIILTANGGSLRCNGTTLSREMVLQVFGDKVSGS